MENDVLELIETLTTMVTEAWGVPLGNEKCIVERDKVLDLLGEMKAQLPTELAEARRLVESRAAFIDQARKEAEMIRKTAEEKARELVEEQEIVRAAKLRCNELLTQAESRARELYNASYGYADDTLKRTEEAISAALSEIQSSRAKFRTSSTGQQSAGPRVSRVSATDLEG